MISFQIYKNILPLVPSSIYFFKMRVKIVTKNLLKSSKAGANSQKENAATSFKSKNNTEEIKPAQILSKSNIKSQTLSSGAICGENRSSVHI
jgi:hypothetical protein